MTKTFESGVAYLTVTPEYVVIEHKAGTMQRGVYQGNDTQPVKIPMDQIKGIEFRDAGLVGGGFLSVIHGDAVLREKPRHRLDVKFDMNTINFNRKHAKQFRECKDLIEKYINQ